ncbi:MAG: 7-carboxy-7-deazaguanine synthase QueE [Candidatus Altiarchaeota archaeon]
MKKEIKFFVNEIFQSIQGEGLLLGTGMNFIRFTKCNKSCKWCDTNFKKGKEMNIKEILKRLDRRFRWVSLTGGEPMLEKNLSKLIKRLRKQKYKIFLETNATLFDEKIFSICDFISIGLKAPSSGNSYYNEKVFSYAIKHPKKTQIKVVIHSKEDISFFRKIYKSNEKYKNWILQPEWSVMKKLDYNAIIREFPKVRIIPQTHKILKVK